MLMLHRARDLLVRQRTMLANAIRGHFAEFGIVAPKGIGRISELAALLVDDSAAALPAVARQTLGALIGQLHALAKQIDALDAQIVALHRHNETSRRLASSWALAFAPAGPGKTHDSAERSSELFRRASKIPGQTGRKSRRAVIGGNGTVTRRPLSLFNGAVGSDAPGWRLTQVGLRARNRKRPQHFPAAQTFEGYAP